VRGRAGFARRKTTEPPIASNGSATVTERNRVKTIAKGAGHHEQRLRPISLVLLENWRKRLVPDEGFEPPTFGLQNRCTATVLIRLYQALRYYAVLFAREIARERSFDREVRHRS
jgi:hypothetical protein